MSDVRDQIGTALEGKLSPEQLETLTDQVLAITKRVWAEFTCKGCSKKQKQTVDIPDAKAVTSAIVDLANQAWGRPQEDRPERAQVTFTRKVVYGACADCPNASET